MHPEKLARINELAKKSRTEGLTAEEKQEQAPADAQQPSQDDAPRRRRRRRSGRRRHGSRPASAEGRAQENSGSDGTVTAPEGNGGDA